STSPRTTGTCTRNRATPGRTSWICARGSSAGNTITTPGDTRMKQVEFFFDVGSPYSYLAYHQLPKIAQAKGAEIVWRPMLLGGVFQATSNSSPATIPAKGRYSNID